MYPSFTLIGFQRSLMLVATIILGLGRSQGQFQLTLESAGSCSIGTVLAFADGYVAMGNVEDASSKSIFLTRLSNMGDTLWTRTYGSPNLLLSVSGMVEANVNGWYISGSGLDLGATNWKGMLLRVDSTGTLMWTRSLTRGWSLTTQALVRIQDTLDQGVVVLCGAGASTHLIRFDEQGDTLWTQYYPTLFGASDMIIRPDGHSVFTSWTLLNDSTLRTTLIEVSSAGQLTQAHHYGVGSGEDSRCIALSYEANSGRYWLGGTIDDAFLQHGLIWSVDPSFEPVWAHQLVSGALGSAVYDVKALEGGGAWITGVVNFGTQSCDNLLAKFDDQGGMLLSRSDDHGWFATGGSLCAKPDGGVLIGGYTTIGTPLIGTLTEADTLGRSNCPAADSVIVSTSISMVHGPLSLDAFSSDVEFDTVTVTVDGAELTKELRCADVALVEQRITSVVTIYPVPTNGQIVIDGLEPMVMIRLLDMMGRPLLSEQVATQSTKLDLSTLSDGVYFVVIGTDSSQLVRRVVVQH